MGLQAMRQQLQRNGATVREVQVRQQRRQQTWHSSTEDMTVQRASG